MQGKKLTEQAIQMLDEQIEDAESRFVAHFNNFLTEIERKDKLASERKHRLEIAGHAASILTALKAIRKDG